jgi:hypothetical protein
MSLDDLKSRITDKCDMAQALVALNRSITPRELDIFKRTREVLAHGSREQLAHVEFVLDVNLQNAEKMAGYKGGSQFILDMGRAHRKGKRQTTQFSKVIIDKFLFENYEKCFAPWRKVQPHALVVIDLEGEDRDLYLPEGSLYEDMCFSFNQGWESRDEAWNPKKERTKAQVKAHIFYKRATIISAYNFVECYFNGLAFDFLATAQRSVSQVDRDLLSEWDSTKKRQKYVKFRDKLIQYPKIILKRKTPPFAESSCPPMATLLSCINFRDAVVHNTPKPNLNDEFSVKVKDLIEVHFGDAIKIVDAAVELVLLVDKTVNQGRYDITWLLPRTAKGPFPAKSFA